MTENQLPIITTATDDGVICDSCESYTEQYVEVDDLKLCEWCG